MLMFEALFEHTRYAGIAASIQAPTNERHAYLINTLSNSIVKPKIQRSHSTLPMEWFELTTPNQVSDIEFVNYLTEKDVHVLPGSFFYWSKKSPPYTAFRVSLSRQHSMFRASVDKLNTAISNFEYEHVRQVPHVFA